MEWPEVDAETLFHACADQANSAAWNEFVRRYGDLIIKTAYRTSVRMAATDSPLLDDLAQEVYLKLCGNGARLLQDFCLVRPNADFAYIKAITVSVVLDHFRGENAARRGKANTVPLSVVPEPPMSRSEGMDRVLTVQELRAGLERVIHGPMQQRDRAVFLLYYQQGWTAKEIAALPYVGLSCEGVESLLGRIVRALRADFRENSSARAAGARDSIQGEMRERA